MVIFNKGTVLISHAYASALNKVLENIIDIIYSYIIMPIPGKTLHRPISNYQIFHRGVRNIYFLFITDLIDEIDIVEKILLKIINTFKEFFPNPDYFNESNPLKSEFLKLLNQIQKELHSKIVIIGPTNSGKTTLYNMLKNDQEKSIRDFAKSASFTIDNLTFDIWDFQLKDNFSFKWSKFIGGADLIVLLFDSKDFNLTLFNHFIKLVKNNGKFSKLLIIANKQDLVSKEEFKEIKSKINNPSLKKISLISPEAKSTINQLIRESLNLKKLMPSNFRNLIKEAESLDLKGNILAAIAKYKELINISNECQEFGYLNTFERKLKLLTIKKKEIERRKKFSAPKQIHFKKKISVKELPKANAFISSASKKGSSKKILINSSKPSSKTQTINRNRPLEQVKKPSNQNKIQKKIVLSPEDIKIKLKSYIAKKSNVKKNDSKNTFKKIDLIESLKIYNQVKNVSEEIVKDNIVDFSKKLQKMIIETGSDLSLALCEKFIDKMLIDLKKPLTFEDIKVATEIFANKEKNL
ncbi:MAG: Rab family GTPase [Promethearchaeota archaeon]